MPKEYSNLEFQNSIDQINQRNRDLEDKLADQDRLKKEMKKANAKQRKLNRRNAKNKAKEAIQATGWTGPALIVLNEKNQQIGYIKDGRMYASVNGPRAQANMMPPNVASRNVKQSWTLPDCEVQEVPMGNGAKCFDVYMKRGGHTRVQRLYPLNLEEEEAVIKALKNCASPVANAWDDGRGVPISWENATPIGGPRAGSKSSKCLKKKDGDKPRHKQPKQKQTSQANSCIKKKQKQPQKPASKPAQSNACLKNRTKQKQPQKPAQSNQRRRPANASKNKGARR